ncbi:MarR family winged helix-turn-helix transcriptional regulator [Nocardioides sambongensis]|uniref:MarR family winged helix-turn-helix transcriptional regulator n=1 Tax=Nocardioides sambongensis TaxID=2589074 RepID=UPI001E489F8C|nr:MarR family transcriptional regulator [Nocardioides sambongensis]
MPTATRTARTDAGLASELRLGVMRLRRRLIAERDPANPLSAGAMAVLGVLHRHGAATPGELAAAERVRPPSMTRTVAALAAGGYVERHPHPEDGRQVVVRITEAGRRTVLADRARRDAWLTRGLAALDAEEREVLRRAAPILDRLAQAD